jgi:hypothetical protein
MNLSSVLSEPDREQHLFPGSLKFFGKMSILKYCERPNSGTIWFLDLFVSRNQMVFYHSISVLVFGWSASLEYFRHKRKNILYKLV